MTRSTLSTDIAGQDDSCLASCEGGLRRTIERLAQNPGAAHA